MTLALPVACRRSDSSLATWSPQKALQQEIAAFRRGDLDAAYPEALKGYQRTAQDDSLHTAFTVELARVQWYRGFKSQALQLLAQPVNSDVAPALQVQHAALHAALLALNGEMGKARALLAEAQVRFEHGQPNPFLEATRGEIERANGEYDAAANRYRSALLGTEALHDDFLQMRMLLNLGIVEIQLEQFDQGRDDSERALRLARKLDARVAEELLAGNLGYAYLGLGDSLRAEANFREAEVRASESGSRADVILWTREQGLAKFRRGDLGGAEEIYTKSLREATELQDRTQVADAHSALGQLQLNSPDGGAAHLAAAANIYAAQDKQQDLQEVHLLQAISEGRHGQQRLATARLLSIEQGGTGPPSVRWRAEQELARLAAAEGDDRSAHRWFERAIHTFRQQQGSLVDLTSRLPFQENGSDLYRAYVEHLIAEGRSREALLVYDQSRATAMQPRSNHGGDERARQASLTRDPRTLARQLNGTVLVYYLCPGTSYLWAISPQRIDLHRLPGEAEIAALVEAHQRLITDSRKDPLQGGDDAGRRLYDALVVPAGEQIKNGEAVYVLADRGLSRLNFDTLLTPGDHPHFWIEDVTIVNASSLALLAGGVAKEARRGGDRLLLVGDPDYPPSVPELPHAADEVQRVAAHFTPAERTVLTGDGATAAAYEKQDLSLYSDIHFVAHAEASLTSPMDSFILLAGGADKLYARDIVKQPLRADLVTLSTCYSSGTRTYSGEGLVGLAWAFERAGSRNVIGALWEVSDDSAPRLMDHLYANLAQGMPPDQALRDAKLTALHSAGTFRKPFYWAQFQLYSNSAEGHLR